MAKKHHHKDYVPLAAVTGPVLRAFALITQPARRDAVREEYAEWRGRTKRGRRIRKAQRRRQRRG